MKKDKKVNLTDVETPEQSNIDEVAQNDPVQSGEGVPNDTVESEEMEISVVPQKGKTKQLPPNVEETKSGWWKPYLITAAVVAVLVVAVAWIRGVFGEIKPSDLALTNETETQYRIRQICDAFTIPGVLCICFGLLVLASNGGAFDMLTYSVMAVFRLFKKDPIDRKYGGYYEYTKAKREKKRSFWYLIIVGAVYLLVGVILLIVYYNV